MVFPFGKREHRPRRFDGPFPEEWLSFLRGNVLLYQTLTDAEQGRVRDAVRVLLAEKFWEGCAGLAMTDEVRVTIAGQAALLLLGFDGYCFDELQTILVYPGGFLSVEEDPLGLEDEVDRNLGQAVYGGPVILSWWEARWGGRRLDAINVVLHEFAHKLAELGDFETGKPPLGDAEMDRRWEEIMAREHEQLAEDAEYGRPTLLDHYGAESRCEFFAVATECFFTQPVKLCRRHPDLYELLAAFYRQDPASRPISEAVAANAREADEEYARHVIAECSAALRQRSGDLEAYRERIGSYCDLGEYANALADCTALIRLAQNDEEKAGAYHERGEVHREADQLNEALADFTEALRLVPDFELAWCSRGAAHAELGETEWALADLTKALRLDPKDDAALTERGLLHYEEGDLDKALRDFSKAIRLCPYVPKVYVHRAWAYLGLKEYEQARADCEEALRLDPENVEARQVQDEVPK